MTGTSECTERGRAVFARWWFPAALLAGSLVRIASLPLPGTDDVIVWKVWAFNAARHGAAWLYGPGGSTSERRELDYGGAHLTVDYPPLALYELGLAGRAYQVVAGRRFPNTSLLTAAVKAPAVAAEAGLAILVFVFVRRTADLPAARVATAAYWLNPAAILDGSVLGYLDPLFVLPAAAALMAASGSPALAGALAAAAALTKAQAIVVVPAVAVAVWNSGVGRPRTAQAGLAIAGAGAATAAIIGPLAAAGTLPGLLISLRSLARHDMLSGNACNLWWIVGYVLRAYYSMSDMGAWAAFTAPTRILAISRVVEIGYPNPRPIGAALALAAMGWALWTARRARDPWLWSALGAFLVHAYATLAAQVHENHLFAGVPLLAIAAAGRRRFVPVFAAVSAIVALNLNLFYGISERMGAARSPYAIPRTLTIVDLTVLLALANCAALVWHARVLRTECSMERTRRQS
jgi:hypothetical protein